MKDLKNNLSENETKKNIRFTKWFGVDANQEDIAFVDIYVGSDMQLFLDPVKLLQNEDEISYRMQGKIARYFTRLLECIRNEKRVEGIEMLKHLSEPREIHLGYSRAGYYGNAVGGIKGEKIYKKLSESNAVKTGILTDLEESALLVEGIDRDIISDISAMICKEELILFTQEQCRKYNVPTDEIVIEKLWNEEIGWHKAVVRLPVYMDEPIILVPKNFVSKMTLFNSQDFYRNEVLDAVQEDLISKNFVRLLKNGAMRCSMTKRELKQDSRYRFSKEFCYNAVQKNPHLLEAYRNRKKHTEDTIDDEIEKL